MGRSGPRQSDILVQAHKTTGESTPDSPYPSGTWQVKPFSILSGKKLSGNLSASLSGNIRSIWGTGNSTSRRRNTPGKVGKMEGNGSKATNYPGQYDQKFQKGVQRRLWGKNDTWPATHPLQGRMACLWELAGHQRAQWT